MKWMRMISKQMGHTHDQWFYDNQWMNENENFTVHNILYNFLTTSNLPSTIFLTSKQILNFTSERSIWQTTWQNRNTNSNAMKINKNTNLHEPEARFRNEVSRCKEIFHLLPYVLTFAKRFFNHCLNEIKFLLLKMMANCSGIEIKNSIIKHL